MTGLAERVMGAAQVGWPLAVVLSCRRLDEEVRIYEAGDGPVNGPMSYFARCGGMI
jgi:hypothetical protein